MGLTTIERVAMGHFEPLGQTRYIKTIKKIEEAFDNDNTSKSWVQSFFGTTFLSILLYILAGTYDFLPITQYLFLGAFIPNIGPLVTLSKALTVR